MKSKILHSILVLVVIFPVICRGQVKPITFEDIYLEEKFDPRDLTGLRFMNDGKNFTLLKDGMILRYSCSTGEFVDVLFDQRQLDSLQLGQSRTGSIAAYEFSSDDRLILLALDRERIWRRSYRARYWVYNRETGEATYLSGNGRQQGTCFSPDGSAVAYVRDNNLFVFDLGSGRERQLTSDGERNSIINGAPDWVYEEEFAFANGFAWSPDSRRIAYYRSDERHVRFYTLTAYGDLYPEWSTYKYPKAGERNSIVTIRVLDLETGRDIPMDTGEEIDQYIPRIWWTGRSGELCILRLNRAQNKLDILLADALTGENRLILEENNDPYIREPNDHTVVFLPGRDRFIYESERTGFHHFYLYDMNGREIGAITAGEWDVIDFLGCDAEMGMIYYTSYEGSSVQSNVWSIRLDGSGKKMVSGERGWNTAKFSKTFDYYIHTHSTAARPMHITLHDVSGEMIRVLEDNGDLKRNMLDYGLPEKELFTITGPTGAEMNAYLYKPKGFREDREYPLLMYVYGGPESQEVRDQWGTNIWHYLMLEKGYAVACVDNRGTDGKGEGFRKAVCMQLGKLETEDQIAAARYLGSLPWIDAGRIGIWGGSYGGFMSLLCLSRGADVFKMAVSLYPVTHFKYYNTIYTERFMGTPRENPDGYEFNSPIFHAGSMEGNLLLVHGMFDDNVHLQNSVDYAEALIQNGKAFEMVFYPNQIHGIRGEANLHLRKKMTRFVIENL